MAANFQHSAYVGTGESYCGVSEAIRVKMNNTPITQIEAALFAKYAWKQVRSTEEEIMIEFSERRTRSAWGTAWRHNKRIILYRWTVGIFLHELAHLTATEGGHGPQFGAALNKLYILWFRDEGQQVVELARRISGASERTP